MKKQIISAAIALALSTPAAAQYVCGDWEPNNICTASGTIQPSYEMDMWAQNYWLFNQVDSSSVSGNGVVHLRQFLFKNTNNDIQAAACSQDCVESAPPVHGPYVCYSWKGLACDPVTGQSSPEFEAAQNAEGWLFVFAMFSDQPEETYMNRYGDYYYVIDREGVPDMGTMTGFQCDQYCDRVASCPDGEVPGEMGVCGKPEIKTTPPETRTIPSESAVYTRWDLAAQHAASQMVSQGDPNVEYGAVLYQTDDGYAYSDLIEKTPEAVTFAATVTDTINSVSNPIGYTHTLPDGDTTDGPRVPEDSTFAQFLQDNFGLSLFLVNTNQDFLIQYIMTEDGIRFRR